MTKYLDKNGKELEFNPFSSESNVYEFGGGVTGSKESIVRGSKAIALNSVNFMTASETIKVLELGCCIELSAAETAVALPILESLKANGDELTLRDVVVKFKAVPELAHFANVCEKTFLVGADYSQIFDKSNS